LTANTDFSRRGNPFFSEAITAATVDRFVDDATILRLTGPGFRNLPLGRRRAVR